MCTPVTWCSEPRYGQPGLPGSISSSSVGRATHRHGGMSRCWPPEQGCSPSPRPGGGPGCPDPGDGLPRACRAGRASVDRAALGPRGGGCHRGGHETLMAPAHRRLCQLTSRAGCPANPIRGRCAHACAARLQRQPRRTVQAGCCGFVSGSDACPLYWQNMGFADGILTGAGPRCARPVSLFEGAGWGRPGTGGVILRPGIGARGSTCGFC